MYFMIKLFQRNSNKYLPLSFLSQKKGPGPETDRDSFVCGRPRPGQRGSVPALELRSRAPPAGHPRPLGSARTVRRPGPQTAPCHPELPPSARSPRRRAGESAPPLEPLSRGEGRGRRRIGLKKLRTFTKGSQLGHDLAVFFGYDTDVPKGNGRNHKYLLLFSLSQK